MKFTTTTILASFAGLSIAAKTQRTFAVLRFNGDGFLTEGPMDPVVSPGEQSSHYHSIMGGSNFATTIEGDQLLSSNCTTSKLAKDNSNYWVPALFFQDPNNGTFQKVPLFYMNVYYFFEPTDDDIVPFPHGMKMVTGNATTRSPPAGGPGINIDAGNGQPINAVQWTCPRTSYDPPSYPVGSDGTTAGIVDPNNQGSGVGFPLYPCDGYASPLRQDMHFPSCYNPAAGLDDYKNNMAFPSTVNGQQNCPEGWTHVPHIFFEVYWNTPLFNDYWTPDGKTQPFVLATGDATGYSSHGDFVGGWDLDTLQTIINTCDAGDSGMDQCLNNGGLTDTTENCHIAPAYGSVLQNGEIITGLPVVGDDITGWGKGGSSPAPESSATSTTQAASSTTSPSTATTTVPSSTTNAETTPTSPATSATTSSSVVAETAPTSATLSPSIAQPTSAATTTTNAPAPTKTGHRHHHSGGYNVETIWDVVTFTKTETIMEPEPTGLHRRVPHRTHGQHKRHGGFAARR
ncbi:hypothetical protein F5Y16DRAFT_376139 [Xylariaceae sp. FL0255]|nr:hypothetical protein F5Y16DRAFT_376139 [Xylariaceae sp. FL0255]